MSRLSRTTINTLENIFFHSSTRQCQLSSNRVVDNLNYLNNNVFNLFLHIDCTGPRIVVPLFCRDYIETIIYLKKDITEVDIALFVNDGTSERKTFNSVIKLFTEVSFSKRLTKIITSKGEIYYGGFGIILDKNMNPIFFCALNEEIDGENLIYKSANIYINPSVFLVDGIIEKGIIKTIIPFYVEKGITLYIPFRNINKQFKRGENGKIIPEVIIKDFTDDFFVRPSKPKPSTFTRDKVNDFLLEHIDDIRFMSHL